MFSGMGAEGFAERARHDPARFFDVGYEEFTADPAGTVESVYGHFGLPFSGAAAAAVRGTVSRGAGPRAGPTLARPPGRCRRRR